MPDHAWGYWHRPQGGWWVWDEQGDATVIGYVAATDEIDEGWVAFPTWTGGLARIVGPFHNRNAAAEALFGAWLADPDTNAPEVHAARISEAVRASRPHEVRPGDATARAPWFPEQGTPQPLAQYSASVMPESVGPKYAGYVRITVDAGPYPPEHIVPPAGEQHAFDAARWARRVEVTVSPKGRSARVWVDGVEIPIRKDDD